MKKRRSAFIYSIPVAIGLGVLYLLLRISVEFDDVSQTNALYFRGWWQDLLIHFCINTIGYAIIIAALIGITRKISDRIKPAKVKADTYRVKHHQYKSGDVVTTRVVGVTYEGRQSAIERLTYEDNLYLVREPDNPYDSNAIKVVREQTGEQVGYINKILAKDIAPIIDNYASQSDEYIEASIEKLTGREDPELSRGVEINFMLPEDEKLKNAPLPQKEEKHFRIYEKAQREKKWPVSSKVTAAENAKQEPYQKQALEKKESRKSTPSTIDVVGILVIVSILCGILAIIAFNSLGEQSAHQTSSVNVNQIAGQSTATRIMASSKPKASTPTERPTSTPSCLHWKSVTGIHVGNHVCVYGRIVKIGVTTKYPVIIRFSEEPGSFMIRGQYRGFAATKGQCIKAEGVVMTDITYLYMDTEEVKLSDYSGCK
ncbi:HIRAN domain-containing protein [Chloroflexota bacterium]